MGAPREVARVRRETLSALMTCPLCRGLLRKATAIAECLHTFCQECIMKEINDEDVDRCPVCNIDLGCDPEEKLRPDHNLQDIRNKIFPIKREKVASSKGATGVLPAKRKQRSLSSLVVDTPRVEIKAAITGRRTIATRRRTASHVSSPDRNGVINLSNKSESQDQMIEKHTASQSTKVIATANKKQRITDVDAPKKPSLEDRKNGKTTGKEELQKGKTTDKEELQKVTTPVWFSLVALPNQKEDPQLPQLSKNYLRIKDGTLKISSVQRYIMTKLDLAHADEVEITCHGEPISPTSTVNGLVDLWVRRETGGPIKSSLGAPAKEFVMVLGYRRRLRAPAP
ncbi:hypothetical protein PR202_ga13414 [Eleusine coracana subsp. coracana]|uniref:RING-type domain-containing protein n=1 Tax=Eleusine coracana subsp. coracana TaxID=191504 RepID=A0AAV5CEW9_ELECO|nr:hypothetical protein QOZ80_3BG0262010 [Eleusine coracana subsp. coracana]GJM96564.1 hypothetical protein PR202_ga13414 [Eleusine coracana subsp. coracana]